jgi:Capsule assembly protein Wzi
MNQSRRSWRAAIAACVTLLAIFVTGHARATPWAEVGDYQLRSDIEVLAAAGLIDNVTMQWPMPWGGIVASLGRVDSLDGQPEYVREAAERVEEKARREVQTDKMNYDLSADFTNLPNVVRGFDGMGREDVQGSIAAEWMGNNTAIRIQVGAQTLNRYDHQTLMLDGSYIAQRIGNVAFYAGYQTHWWGPGWDTALSLSNNARPFPQIGYRRLSTKPFTWPILRWLGPWNHEMFFGIFDDPRLARNTIFHGTRFEFNPFKGFEFAIARLTELCGTGHPCEPIAELFNVQNGNSFQSKSKDEADLDFRYTNTFEGFTYEIYNQEMNRDTGPFVHSDTSHLFGASVWVPIRDTAVRFTTEYADTISTENFFSFGKDLYGITYSDFKYVDGWQYRGRTLGSSLDTDSRLASFHASWIGPASVTYQLSFYRAWISSPLTAANHAGTVASPTLPPVSGNLVTAAPVVVDIGEARVKFPLKNLSVEVAVRLQDDQPRPDRGFAAAGELSINYRL